MFQSAADRDGMLSTGAAEGGAQTWERLDELLAREAGDADAPAAGQ